MLNAWLHVRVINFRIIIIIISIMLNAAKFGWCPLLECCAVTLPKKQNARLGRNVNFAPCKILLGGKSPENVYIVYQPKRWSNIVQSLIHLHCSNEAKTQNPLKYAPVWWHVSATLFFSATTIFFQKILCCGKFVTTHYFLSLNTLFFQKILCRGHGAQHNIFCKNNVFWANFDIFGAHVPTPF